MSNEAKNGFDMKVLHAAIVLAFCLLFRFIPPIAPLTPMGMAFIGTFLGAIYGWTTMDMFFPSFAAILGIIITIGLDATLVAGFGNMTIVGMCMVFMVMGVCTELGVVSWIVDRLLGNKMFVGKPWLFVWFLMFASVILGMFGAVFLIIIVIQFLVAIFQKIGAEPYSKLSLFIIIGVVFSMSMGQVIFPYMGYAIVLVNVYQAMTQSTLNIAAYAGYTFPLATILTVLYVLLMRFVFRVDVSPFTNLKAEDLGETKETTPEQKKALILFVGMFVGLFCGSITALGPVYVVCSKLGMVGLPMIVLMCFMILKREDGTPLANVRNLAGSVAWDMLLLTAFILIMSNYMTNPETGISAALTALLMPMTKLSPWIFIIGVLVFTAVMTNVTNNLILTIVVMPFLLTFLAQIPGLPTAGIIYLLFFTCALAICTPGGSVLSAAAYARTDYVKASDMLKTTIMVFPFLMILEIVLGLALAVIMF